MDEAFPTVTEVRMQDQLLRKDSNSVMQQMYWVIPQHYNVHLTEPVDKLGKG